MYASNLQEPWPVLSRPPVSPLEAKPPVSSWPPRLPVRAPRQLGASRSLIATGELHSHILIQSQQHKLFVCLFPQGDAERVSMYLMDS